jgi:hypothetical protein
LFNDAAAVSVRDAAPPFLGAFRPEGALADFRGKPGAGEWKLVVMDDELNGLSGTLRCWTLNLAPAVCDPGTGPCQSCPDRRIYGVLKGASTVQDGMLRTNGLASECGVAKPCPGLTNAGTAIRYDAYRFVNGPSNACITVWLQCYVGAFSAAYLNHYNPRNLCENYLADCGTVASWDSPVRRYDFEVPANAEFVVVVNQDGVADMTVFYTISVWGGQCEPRLAIDRGGPGTVALRWPSFANDYYLESVAQLHDLPNAFVPVLTPPIVHDGHFVITQDTVGATNRFYRLRKP